MRITVTRNGAGGELVLSAEGPADDRTIKELCGLLGGSPWLTLRLTTLRQEMLVFAKDNPWNSLSHELARSQRED